MGSEWTDTLPSTAKGEQIQTQSKTSQKTEERHACENESVTASSYEALFCNFKSPRGLAFNQLGAETRLAENTV